MFESWELCCFPIRIVALHFLHKHSVHALFILNWKLQENCFNIEIRRKLEDKLKLQLQHKCVSYNGIRQIALYFTQIKDTQNYT